MKQSLTRSSGGAARAKLGGVRRAACGGGSTGHGDDAALGGVRQRTSKVKVPEIYSPDRRCMPTSGME
uniref:Uncharacterized protein n=1 Tax=Oryza sativa subsp. japonica TaxID=39947 RepID=Q6Z9A4_ORYSJ|nr:hypothetical protein [Oryza sativa Japonica Group]